MLNRNYLLISLIFLGVFYLFVWGLILFKPLPQKAEFYFLDVGQGDSQMVVLPGGVKILIDGGPNNKVLNQLASALSPFDRYIDLVVMSHPQTDHFNGLIDVLKRYRVGAFISSGNRGKAKSFGELEKAISANNVPVVTLAEGDKIKYNESYFDILAPSENLLQSAEPNDWALVMKLLTPDVKALFTGDIDSKEEIMLAKKYDLDVDILKVAHHGSKFSTSEEFLRATTPKLAAIGVGAKNSYGHPTSQTLKRLQEIGSQIFRTDKDGLVKLVIDNEKINVFKKK